MPGLRTRWTSVGRPAARWDRLIARIGALEQELVGVDGARLLKRSLSLRYRAKSGHPAGRLLPEAFALVREAARRTLDMRHFDVQLLGGAALCERCVAEMQTGEGKTLTATLPLYLFSLFGCGAHLATANDYLARRDAEWMRPVFEALGVSVGVVESATPRPQRRAEYACDVTYGTAKEFGFDFLRDCLVRRQAEEGESDRLGEMLGIADAAAQGQIVQRDPCFALIDEADSVLIDEAGTPMIISSRPGPDHEVAAALFRWAASMAGRFEQDVHYDYDYDRREVALRPQGRRLVRELPKPELLARADMNDLCQYAQRAVKVARDFLPDRHYTVRDGEVVIVDEFTGRLAEGRKWRDGIHQAIEAKEGLDPTVETGQAARITVQDYFRRYGQLAGMTGTAGSSGREFRKIYGLRVVRIPTNRPPIRRRLPDRVFGTSEAKWQAVAREVAKMHRAGRPVLVGTRSIDKSERLSKLLTDAGVRHQVLNARHVAREAQIVAEAGHTGRVTVATNMAGRGTDIQLDDKARELGGLHVVCTELHDAARIDRQLIGRSGRQGDPGSFRQVLALDDEILLIGLGPDRAEAIRRLGGNETGPLDHLARLFRRAQAKIERRHSLQRRALMHFERRRQKVQRQMGLNPYLDTPV